MAPQHCGFRLRHWDAASALETLAGDSLSVEAKDCLPAFVYARHSLNSSHPSYLNKFQHLDSSPGRAGPDWADDDVRGNIIAHDI